MVEVEHGAPSVFEVRATIVGSSPSIYRVVRLSGNTILQIVHEAMQAAFCWGNVHLHYFKNSAGERIRNESQTTLAGTLTASTPLVYVYDFGDSWTVSLELLGATEGAGRVRPTCVGGERKSPPEDCGGIAGYYDALDLLEYHNSNALRKFPLIAEWYGESFDPEQFDVGEVNRRMGNIVLR